MKRILRTIAVGVAMAMATPMANANTEWHLAMDDVWSVPVTQLSCLVVVDNSNEIKALDKLGQAVLMGQNVTFRQEESGSLVCIANDARILMASEQIKILGADAEAAEVYDVNGRKLAAGFCNGGCIVVDIRHLMPGTYILSTNGIKTKFVKN